LFTPLEGSIDLSIGGRKAELTKIVKIAKIVKIDENDILPQSTQRYHKEIKQK